MTELCIDFGGSVVKVGLSSGGALGATGAFPVTGSADDLTRAATLARELGMDSASRVAIAVPGLVTRDGRGMAIAHGKYAWMLGADLTAWARDVFDAEAVVENDARAALAGETASGCAIGARDAVILVLGTGIGTAAMLDGAPLRGPDGSAGILGSHLTIDWDGPDCNCGNVGCAEVYGATWALASRIRERLGGEESPEWSRRLESGLGFEELFALDDAVTRAVLADAVRAWSATVVSLCHAYDPATVIIAGGVARAAERFVPAIELALAERLWGTLPRPDIVVSTAPELSVLRGLASWGAKEGMS